MLKGVRKIVADVVEDLQSNNEAIPSPFSAKHYRGKFIVRIPPDTHRELTLEAAESGISLNRLVSAKLSK